MKALEALVILGLLLLLLAAQLSAYASILRVPSRDWALIGRTKGSLLALVFFTGGVGGLYYWTVIRRELRAT
ncbi:MAG TPA: hypothetical protein VG795_06095 [Acidimicrobiia bacterium]|nr:hypothetical protein [Acidimicrobiia bacterium]